jgi:hypothetical protein
MYCIGKFERANPSIRMMLFFPPLHSTRIQITDRLNTVCYFDVIGQRELRDHCVGKRGGGTRLCELPKVRGSGESV